MKTVVAFGIFDLLHPGHLAYLEAAKKLGDTLVVMVGRDELARKKRGRRLVMREQDRLRIVRALRCVDAAILGDRGKIYRALLRLKPDILAIGYDQDARHPVIAQLAAHGLCPKIIRIRRWGSHASSRVKTNL